MKNKVLYIYNFKKEVLINKGVFKKIVKKFEFLNKNLNMTFMCRFHLDKNQFNLIKFNNIIDYTFILFKIINNFKVVRSYDTSIHSLIACFLCKIYGIKFISSSHGHLKQIFYRNKIKKFLRIIIEKMVLINSTAVICASKSLQQQIKKLNKNAVYIPTWGVDSDFFLKDKYPIYPKQYILYVGRIHPTKKIEKIIEVYIRSQCFNLYDLLIVGPIDDEKYFSYLNLKYNKFIKNNKVKFIFGIENQHLYEFYLKSRCLFMSSDMEGTPNPVLEALSLNVPVLSSDVGDIRHIIFFGKNGYYFDKKTSLEKRAELLDIVANLEVDDEYGRNFIKKFFSKEIINNKELNLIKNYLK